MKEFLLKVREDIYRTLPESFIKNLTPENIFYRAINFLFFGWLMSLYVYVPFLVYMSNYGFFSYDFFINGLFAINVISLYVVLFLIVFSMILSGGFGIAFACKLSEYNIPKGNKLGIVFNIFIIILFVLFVYDDFSFSKKTFDIISWLSFLLFVSLPISFHISLMIFGSAKNQFFSAVLSFCFVLPVLFFNIFPDSTSKLTSIILKKFNIGGNVDVKIDSRLDNKISYIGKMIFLSPDNIFLLNEEGTIILERRDLRIIFPTKE